MKRALTVLLALLLSIFGAFAIGDEETELIRQGAKGEIVVRIQERLFDLGYYTYKPTGSYQTVTRAAAVSYQLASGLMSDGTIGIESINALFSRSAVRAPFHATVPLTYTAQSGILSRGIEKDWDTVKAQLVLDASYTVTNAANGETCTLVFTGGENHAEFALPAMGNAQSAARQALDRWLGETNSFYKCAVLLDLDGQPVAASIHRNGDGTVCLYVTGCTSHVFGLPDLDHEATIRRIVN